MRRRARQEDGAVLLIALGFITFIGVVAVALGNYAFTNLRATIALRPVRAAEFAADGAVEGAINKLRQDPTACAGDKTNFYKVSPVINNQPVDVDCDELATSPSLRVLFIAKCASGGAPSCPAGTKLLVARVRLEGSVPSVKAIVESWSVQ